MRRDLRPSPVNGPVSLGDYTNAADLKSLGGRMFFAGTSDRKRQLEFMRLLVPMTFPKFVKVGAAMDYEFRKSGH
jgi:hypothetical protein